MFQVILRFALRQSDCRFFHFSAENLPIPLRVNDLRNLSVSGTIFGITTIKRTHNSLRIRTYRSVDSRELKTVWNQHLQKNRGEGGLIVNQIPYEGICPEEHRDEGSLFTSDEDAYPERVRRGGRVEARDLAIEFCTGSRSQAGARVKLQQTQRVHIHQHGCLRNLIGVAIGHGPAQQLRQHGPLW